MNQGPVCCCSHTEEICLTVFILFYVQIALDMPVGTYFREGTCTFFFFFYYKGMFVWPVPSMLLLLTLININCNYCPAYPVFSLRDCF